MKLLNYSNHKNTHVPFDVIFIILLVHYSHDNMFLGHVFIGASVYFLLNRIRGTEKSIRRKPQPFSKTLNSKNVIRSASTRKI